MKTFLVSVLIVVAAITSVTADKLDLGKKVQVNFNTMKIADKFITDEVRQHLRAMTNHEPALTIGKEKLVAGLELRLDKKLGPDAFASKVVGKKIILTGGNVRGVYYAVMDFFEMLGCRWFAPGEKNVVIPRLKTIKVDRNWQSAGTPAFRWRGYHICGYGKTRDGKRYPHFDYDTALWMARNKMNFKPVHNQQYQEVKPILNEVMLSPLAFGHSYHDWFKDQDFVKNPEYFALINGKRNKGAQLCVSNKTMRRKLIKRIVDFARNHPGLPVISLAPNDGYRWCECASCVAMDSPEDRRASEINNRNHAFAAAIVAEVRKQSPEVVISTISYCNYQKAGKDVPYEKNLAVSICVTRDQNRALNNAKSASNKIFHQRVKNWRAKAGNVIWSEYILSYGGTFPRPYEKPMQQTLQELKRLGVVGFKSEVVPGRYERWQSAIFYMYFVARVLYNVNLDIDKLLKDFCEKFYGPAAPYACNYYLINRQVVARYPEDFFAINAKFLPQLYSNEDIFALHKSLKQAEKAVKNNPEASSRIGLLRKQLNEIIAARQAVLDAEKEAVPVAVKMLKQRPDWSFFEKTTLIPIRNRSNCLPFKPASGFTLARTGKSLWLYVRCGEPAPEILEKLRKNMGKNVFGYSNIDCFISPSPESGEYYQLAVNFAGNVYDSKCKGRIMDTSHDLQPDVRVRMRDFGWEIIVGVPFTQLGEVPKAGTQWRAAINRGRKCGGPKQLGGWPNGGSWHKIKTMGILQF
jgi:Domain of unknown function (DUF4838)